MNKKNFLICMIFPIIALTQDPTPDTVPPPDYDVSDQLLYAVTYGASYYSMVPLQSGATKLQIDNLSIHENAILLVGMDSAGNREETVLHIEPEMSLTIPEETVASYEHVYLVSMQAFQVHSEEPVNLLGIKTRVFTTVSPMRHLELIPVAGDDGGTVMVGVAPDGNAYYPVYGYKIGTFDPKSKTLFAEDGKVFDVQK